MMKERWVSVWRVRRDSVLGVGTGLDVGVEGEGEGENEENKDGGTNTIVERTDSEIMMVVNNNVFRTVHICVVNSLDSGSNTRNIITINHPLHRND
jgi:hypothetical protein